MKFLLVTYPDPVSGHPTKYVRDSIPEIGTSLSAQARYCAGTREILEDFLEGRPYRTEYLIADKGRLAGAGAHSYTTRK
jgi:formate dehydrogenase